VGDAIPFRFGANALRAASRAEWFDNARRVEDLGYGVLAVPDHLAERLAPLPALVSAASVTTRLRLVTDDRRQAAEDLARTWTALSADEIRASPHVLIGTVDEMVEDLEARGLPAAGVNLAPVLSRPSSTNQLVAADLGGAPGRVLASIK
jgi:hypothetical protein